jgi:hypothetical protein
MYYSEMKELNERYPGIFGPEKHRRVVLKGEVNGVYLHIYNFGWQMFRARVRMCLWLATQLPIDPAKSWQLGLSVCALGASQETTLGADKRTQMSYANF